MEKIPTTTAYIASGVATIFGLTVNEFVAFAGVTIALLTFMTNLIFKYLHYRLEKEKQHDRP
ncbi:HP1 family phage holin [Kiloniella laminariae]|uniref:HP1 family phage holin n=1 Tax=Kiloniella laminariae TaxID=454162 RepID=A0ABT4LP27_9PROT|nr:HP1 family phage holin [Kiloniella laminariae]MCZ4281712.1 HP1 family phage holin [Kiloniella laminariae]